MRFIKLVILTGFLFSQVSVFSSGQIINTQKSNDSMQIDLVLSESEIAIGQVVDLTIRIKQKGNAISQQGTLNIAGLDQFDIVGERSMNSMNIVNGDMASIIEKHLNLRAKGAGVFNIGPVSIDNNGNDLTSNTVTLKVGKENFTNKKQESGTGIINNDASDLFENVGKINYFESLFSVEFFLLLLIVGLAFYLISNNKTQGVVMKSGSEDLFYVPNYNEDNFLDKCLLILNDFILKTNNLSVINISHSELKKLEWDFDRRKMLGEIVSEIYLLKKGKDFNKEKLKELSCKISRIIDNKNLNN